MQLTWGFSILGLDVVIFIISNMAAVVLAGKASVGFWLLSCIARAAPICFSFSSGSGLDVFQIPYLRKALFVSGYAQTNIILTDTDENLFYPTMITFQRARQIAEAEINKQHTFDNDSLIIIDDQTIQKDYLWIFPYTSKK